MARRRPERPTFEPPVQPGPPASPPTAPSPPPPRPGRDPLRAMAPVFVTLAAIAVTALAVWLPVREAQDESLKHYASTRYIDVRRGTTFVWHDVQWRMTSMRQVPWKYYNGASPPPKSFVRFHILLHVRLLGPKARLGAIPADDYLHGDLTGQTFEYEIRDRDDRAWEPFSLGTDPRAWHTYQPAKGLDLEIYADAPAGEADEVALCVRFEDHKDDFNFSKTPSPRVTMLRFAR